MEDKINSVIKTALNCNCVSTNIFLLDGMYKTISTIMLPSENYSEDFIARFADEDLYLELLGNLLEYNGTRIDTYSSTTFEQGYTIYLDVTFKYPIPITERVTRKSMLTLLKSELR